jgi:AcrR family transcriptional regulator
MRILAVHGPAATTIQRVADDVELPERYVYRLFGTRHALVLACTDEVGARLSAMIRRAAAAQPEDPLSAAWVGFRRLIADGVIAGCWLQACAAARTNEAIAARCRDLIAQLREEVGRLGGARTADVDRFLAYAALAVMMRALAVDLAEWSPLSPESWRTGHLVLGQRQVVGFDLAGARAVSDPKPPEHR